MSGPGRVRSFRSASTVPASVSEVSGLWVFRGWRPRRKWESDVLENPENKHLKKWNRVSGNGELRITEKQNRVSGKEIGCHGSDGGVPVSTCPRSPFSCPDPPDGSYPVKGSRYSFRRARRAPKVVELCSKTCGAVIREVRNGVQRKVERTVTDLVR